MQDWFWLVPGPCFGHMCMCGGCDISMTPLRQSSRLLARHATQVGIVNTFSPSCRSFSFKLASEREVK